MGGLAVDPPRLAAAGRDLVDRGDELAAALAALESALAGSGQMCGDDPAGKAFALSYRQGGQALFSAAEAGVRACCNVGYGTEVSARNYACGEAASTVGGGEPSVSTPVAPPCFSGPTMPNPFGPAVGQPFLWALVSQWVGSPWPDGNPVTLRAAATAWREFGSATTRSSEGIGGTVAVVSGHDIPELDRIGTAINKLSSGVGDLGTQCASIAGSLEAFAGEIEASQEAIRDLLHRLSASRVASTIGGIFTGHNPMDDVRAVANDIREILHTLNREADGASSMFQSALNALDPLTTELEDWARREFTHFLGEEVGGVVADAFTGELDVSVGGLKSVLEGVGGLEHLVTHPQDLAKLAVEINPLAQAMNFAHDPKGFIDGKLETAKGLVDAKDWTSDHPLRGLGHNAGTIAQFLVPGLGEAKGGATVGRVAEEAGQAARVEGEAARAGVGLVRGGVGSDVAAQGARIGHDLDGISVKPADAGPMPAPARPVEPSLIKPVEPGPARAPTDAPRVGDRAPVVPGVDGGAGGGVHPPGEPAAEGAGPGPGVGVHEPAPVGSPTPATAADPAVSPGTGMPQSTPLDGQPAGSTPIEPHAPEAAQVAPVHEPDAGVYPDAAQPLEPPAVHDPGVGDVHDGPGDGHNPGDHGGPPELLAPDDHSPDAAEDPHAGDPLSGGLTDEKRDEILAMEKGTRPDPSEYLSSEYIERHLEHFDQGATRFMPDENFNRYGIGQRDGSTFVFPTSEIDSLMAKGDIAGVEDALGLPPGYFEDYNIVRVDIRSPRDYGLRLPSGNEAGANEYWLPGGLLPEGMREAVIDGSSVPSERLTIADLPGIGGR